MTTWLYSISGVIILSGLLDLVLSEGETKKYVKGIISLIVIFVIIAPLASLLNPKTDSSWVFPKDATSIQVNQSFLSSITFQREEQAQLAIEQALASEGLVANVKVNSDDYNGVFYIKNVTCTFNKSVINELHSNIDINKKIKSIIRGVSGVADEEIIIIYAG